MQDSSLKRVTPLGKALRLYRIDHNLTQRDMASAIGVSCSYLSSCEIGKKSISDEAIKNISDTYPDLFLSNLQNLREDSITLLKIDLSGMKEDRRKKIRGIISSLEGISDNKLSEAYSIFK